MPFTLPKCHENLLESTNLGFLPFEITRLSLHVMVMGLFASLIGPFGGFFASGLKRSIKIKVKNIKNIGFRKFNPRTWRSNWSNGLPGYYRYFRILLPSLFYQNQYKHSRILAKYHDHTIKNRILWDIDSKFWTLWNYSWAYKS